jgi:rubrerythrin
MSKLSELVKELRAIELEHADELEATMEALPGRLASALVEGIMHDSRKHAAFCDAILEIEAEQVPDDLEITGAVEMLRTIEGHIGTEEQMIKQFEVILPEAKDDRSREILNSLLADERRHHAVLTGLKKLFSGGLGREAYYDLIQDYMYGPPPKVRKRA